MGSGGGFGQCPQIAATGVNSCASGCLPMCFRMSSPESTQKGVRPVRPNCRHLPSQVSSHVPQGKGDMRPYRLMCTHITLATQHALHVHTRARALARARAFFDDHLWVPPPLLTIARLGRRSPRPVLMHLTALRYPASTEPISSGPRRCTRHRSCPPSACL